MSKDAPASDLFSKFKAKFHREEKIEPAEKIRTDLTRLYKNNEITEREFSMMEGIVDFQSTIAREVMVPRTDAFMINIQDDLKENLEEILRQPYSRVPVYDGEKDKIVGIIHIRTILRVAWQKGFDRITYHDVISTPLYASELTEISELLTEMQETQRQIAILTDEYGGVVGLVTIEDLIEEIVGDIDDEVDQAEVLYKELTPFKYIVYGKMTLAEFNDKFKTDLQMEDVDTIAGYLITKLGVIPAKGEKLSVTLDNGITLTTRRMKGSRILTLLVTIPEKNIKEEANKK
ncbi:hemolysin family protein [Lactobacillus sp. PV034]|uniref:hemolysin family protein n=1 Tax=Lactobacillus sp. PV034 TaxID=2594495 RepID=UPI00223EA278|nr:hemolysin family protein [Lactobacillus sp. PV034]QNQ80753.1 HlyC/CorC family transporter [Lactobacillus sp. PV034]